MNVGGHRRFRPSVLAGELREFDVVSVGAAGTFVARRPPSPASFRKALIERLPFETHLVVCDGREILALETAEPFGTRAPASGIVRFVSVLPGRAPTGSLPLAIPERGRWLVRLIGSHGRFVVGEYRRDMRTIRHLGAVDGIFGVPATTRNWNTILKIVEILKRRTSR